MMALDTNVIVRFLVRDDEKQAQAVLARFKQAETGQERLMVSMVVVLETIWVLESAYEKTREEVLDSLDDLRMMAVLEFEDDAMLQAVISDGRRVDADLSDLLLAHAARAYGCEKMLTFDKKATRFPFCQLLK